MPTLAACRQQSSRGTPRPNTPRVTPCLRRPFRDGACAGCASPVRAAASDAALVARNSRRFIALLPASLIQDEGDQPRPCAGDHVLLPVELVSNRTVGDGIPETRVPERLSGRGVVGADPRG